jgi:hypothetical protein
MRPLFNALTIIFVIIGFFIPLVWVLAVVTAVLAIGSAPDGLRVDGKANSGRSSGGGRDDIVVSQKSRACPTCLGMVSKYASKCQYCGERLEVTSS